MSIKYDEKEKIFALETNSTAYYICITDKEGFIGHIYYGKKFFTGESTNTASLQRLLRTYEPPFTPQGNARDRLSFLDCHPFEYSGNGFGDYRHSAISVKTTEGHCAIQPLYVSHKMYKGKEELAGLPYCSGGNGTDGIDTLEILCRDNVLGLEITLKYTVYEKEDSITRSVYIKNTSEKSIYLEKVMSMCLDMDNEDYDLITLHGSWGRERHIERKSLRLGYQGVSSVRGEEGHQDHPFMALANKNTTQNSGDAYGFAFVYSGNYVAEAGVNQFNSVRLLMGINPEGFAWKLESGADFTAPEVILTYSDKGLGGMSRNFHDIIRNRLIRGKYAKTERPILINNWEATYFNFDTEKLLSIAKTAAENGIEMLVMDDGWFGTRNDDNCSLGDWFVNQNKLSGGLKPLVDGVNKLGLKFGIWFEPEMISPDSDIYRAHPDWAIQIPGREPGRARNQLVLDLTRPEAFDYVYNCLSTVLHSANIEYVKWDMNRPLADIGSGWLPEDRQGELFHRQTLAVYKLQEKLLAEFPYLLLENCSGGGARFDAGMLYYSPQIWCSDDTDAIERLSIQEGTALVYPLSCMGAHVSDCPNHVIGRVTPFETRGHVALAGTFGYELDVTRIPEQDRKMIPQQVAMYKKYNALVRGGDYYRIASYSENGLYDCWENVSKDKSEALVTFVQVLAKPNIKSRKIKLYGLDPQAEYKLEFEGFACEKDNKVYGEVGVISGSLLMNAGILVQDCWGDFHSRLIHIVKA